MPVVASRRVGPISPMVRFLFESDPSGGYVGVLADSDLVPGPVVTQNAGSTNLGMYYQVGGGGLNGAFALPLGAHVGAVNLALGTAYDTEFGAGVVGMVYSAGPVLTSAGLTGGVQAVYTGIYAAAMARIAASPTPVAGFRVTMLSSGIYRGNAPIGPFAEAAAGCIIDAVRTAVRTEPDRLARVAILVNANLGAAFPVEVAGFSRAAAARDAEVTGAGFSLPVDRS